MGKEGSRSEKLPSSEAKGEEWTRSEKSERFEGMKKEWPPLKECPQFKYGMISQYMKKFDFEDEELSDEKVYFYGSSDEEEEEGKERRRYWYKPSDLKKFLDQARNSRGYEVNIIPPSFMNSPFMLVYPYYPDLINLEVYQAHLRVATKSIIDHIKSKTGKVYKYVETLRFVDSPNRILLLTFTAKEEDAADDAPLETFLAAVSYVNMKADEVLECFLKPDGPAPTDDMIQ